MILQDYPNEIEIKMWCVVIVYCGMFVYVVVVYDSLEIISTFVLILLFVVQTIPSMIRIVSRFFKTDFSGGVMQSEW